LNDNNSNGDDEVEVFDEDYQAIAITVKEAKILSFTLMIKQAELFIYKHLFFALLGLSILAHII